MKNQRSKNQYAAFNEFMIRQSVRIAAESKIDDNDHNEFRSGLKKLRGRSADIEFYDGESEEVAPLSRPFVFAERKPLVRAVLVKAKHNDDEKPRIREKKWSDDSSADREGFMEKRERGSKRSPDHDNDGLESAEDKDPVLVVSGRFNSEENRRARRDEFSARRSG